MTAAIAYPAALPGVSADTIKRAERGQASEDRGYVRTRMRDKTYEFEATWEVPFDLAVQFKNWYEIDLIHGQRKASIPLPGVGGILPRVCQFKTPLEREVITSYGYRYSATLSVVGVAR